MNMMSGHCPWARAGMSGDALALPRRRLTAADRGALARHLLALDPADRRRRFRGPMDDTTIHRQLRALDFGRAIVWGALDQEEVVGAAMAQPIGPGAVEVAVSVLPATRGQGLGTALVAEACRAARRAGAVHAILEFGIGDPATRRVAQRVGAECDGRIGLGILSLRTL